MLCIPMAYWFCNWKSVPLDPLHPLCPPPNPPSFLQPPICFLYLWVWLGFVCCLDSTYQWNHRVFVYLLFISVTIIPLRSMSQMARSHPFLWPSNIPWCTYTISFYPFVYGWTPGLLPYLGNCKECCNGHRGCMYLFELIFLFSLDKYQKWNSWVIW